MHAKNLQTKLAIPLVSLNKNIEQKSDLEKTIKFEIELINFIVQNHSSFLVGEKILRFIKSFCLDFESF
jgi:hypothetical protein